jgi:hypothetical protein
LLRSLGVIFGRRGDISAEIRLLAAVVVLILIAAVVILYLFPDTNGERWAWPVRPRLSAMTLGGIYVGGTLFFVSVLVSRRWHEVQAGFLAITVFASMLGIATILHWDRFSHTKPVFWLWAGLYFAVPFILPVLWWRNQQAAKSGNGDSPKVELPVPVRLGLAAVMLPELAIAALLFLAPGVAIDIWPWTITPLTARVIAAPYALYGSVGLVFLIDPDWTKVRWIMRWQLLTPVFLILIPAVASWSNLDTGKALTWVYLVNGLGVLFLGISGLYFYMERRTRSARLVPPSSGR